MLGKVYTISGKGKKRAQTDTHSEGSLPPHTHTITIWHIAGNLSFFSKCGSTPEALSTRLQTVGRGKSPLLLSLGHEVWKAKDIHFHLSVPKGQGLQGHPSTEKIIVRAFSTKWPFYHPHTEKNPSPKPPLPKAQTKIINL